ncbi:TOP3A [Bugula neritina]|uniref:DNA topoisomerase n=1 Tax=Bugula neritina TaxID=10212 RepID=A0A7J7KA03_BUGNE|nr:TOP3A [Bugula neritina]
MSCPRVHLLTATYVRAYITGREFLLARSGAARSYAVQRLAFLSSDARVVTPLRMKVLNVAEKNDAAKSIANVMSRGSSQRREGYSQYNKIYQFDYMFQGQQVTMVMTSVSGHLQDVEFGGQYKSWKSCSPLALFDAPLVKFVPDKFQPIKRTLEREARGAQKLIIWTDCDREGENIGFEIIDVVTQANPRIQVLRARFSEITANSVNRALSSLRPPDHLQNDAVEVRRELDLRIGAAFTRFLTLRYQTAFPELSDMIISYGSCQFPTLGFVVERYKQIQEFKSEPFWKLSTTLQEERKRVTFNWKRVRLFDYDAVRALYEECIANPVATVTDVRKKSKSKWRPVALDTVEFEKHMSRKLKISAKTAMGIAEKLYTAGYVSYPRTETNKFPHDFNLRELVQQQTGDAAWGEFANRVLEEGVTPRNGNKSDEAHPPIHPIKYAPNLQGDEKRVYEYITRHFLACCSKDAKGFETTVEIEISSEKKWSDKDIPVFSTGDRYQPDSIQIQSGETSPPNLLTEADLIALMEKHGIGTDATHAEHIEKIQQRSYAGVQDNKFLPGKLGMGLVEADLESDLKLICEGKRAKDDVLRDQIRKYREKFEISLQRVADIDGQMQKYLDTQMGEPGVIQQTGITDQPAVRKCPSCNCDMTLRQKSSSESSATQSTQTPSRKGGYYIGCSGYPQCRNAIWLPRQMLEVRVLEENCPVCGPDTKLLQIQFKPGSVPPFIDLDYTGCIMCDKELKEAFSLNIKSTSSSTSSGMGGANTGSSTARGGTNSGKGSNNNWPGSGRGGTSAGRGGTSTGRGGTSTGRGGTSTGRGGTSTGRGGTSTGRGGTINRQYSTTPSAPMMSHPGMESANEENVPVCMCSQIAIVLTVKKEGPNQGRQFYKCNEGKCNFFLWADQPPEGSGNSGARQYDSPHSDLGNVVKCGCNMPANRLTVQKDGPNKGREFYACSKPRDQSCRFFQWADQETNSGGGANRGGGTRGRGGAGREGGASKGGGARGGGASRGGGAKRKCGQCREEGHTKKTCPQLNSF